LEPDVLVLYMCCVGVIYDFQLHEGLNMLSTFILEKIIDIQLWNSLPWSLEFTQSQLNLVHSIASCFL